MSGRTTMTQFEVLRCLRKAFRSMEPISDLDVDSYRIDLFIPSLRVAVFCAEDGAFDRKDDERRRDFLVRVLRCRFVEFDSHLPDFDIFDLINEIYCSGY